MTGEEQRVAQLRCLIANGERLVEHLREWHLETHDGHERWGLHTRLTDAAERLQANRAELDAILLPAPAIH